MQSSHTRHSRCRARQRAVPPLAIDWLLQYGRRVYANGAEVLFFDKRGRRQLEHDIGSLPVARLGSLLDTYLVLADGDVVTVGHRTRRIQRR